MAVPDQVSAPSWNHLSPGHSTLRALIGRTLRHLLGSPIWAAAFSGAVLTLALVLVGLAVLRSPPNVAGAATLPWWAWAGGLCGAFVLTATTAVAPRLGTAAMIALVVAGQVACSLALDRFGLFGLAAYPLTPRRLAAAALLVAGAALIR